MYKFSPAKIIYEFDGSKKIIIKRLPIKLDESPRIFRYQINIYIKQKVWFLNLWTRMYYNIVLAQNDTEAINKAIEIASKDLVGYEKSI